MDQRHAEYVEYYRSRLKKFEGNPMYPHSEAAERAMFDAIATASSLEEFRTRQAEGKLALACAIATVRDEQNAQIAFLTEIQESVRVQPHLEILRNLDSQSYTDVGQVTTMVSEVMTRWNLEIARDETLIAEFWPDWKVLEDIEMLEQAAVPEAWFAERQASHAAAIQRGREHYHGHSLPETRKFVPDYMPDHQALWQPRHRRKVPLADDIVAERIAGHKRYVGVE